MKLILLLIVLAGTAVGQASFNYDEGKVGAYTLPDPLKMNDGGRVTTAAMWVGKRRQELLREFGTEIYGVTPTGAVTVTAATPVDGVALGGKAVRRQVTLLVKGRGMVREMHLLVYLPKDAKGPVPVFLGLNFSGNQTVSSDPGITLYPVWAHPEGHWLAVTTPLKKVVPAESERGQAESQWQAEMIVGRGYGLATMYDGDVEADSPAGLAEGARPLFYQDGQSAPKDDEWGTLGAWAWGLSRAAEYLRTMPGVDAKGIILFGHSRLGKTALWAGAQDTSFAMVIANESGKGGAALAKRNYGQTTADLNRAFPHWFDGNYKKYSGHEDRLPVDNHELIALIASRPVYIGAAVDDQGGDPKGQMDAEVAAGPVYELLGKKGLGTTVMPAVDTPVRGDLGYHIRPGKHGVMAYDWMMYLDYADVYFGPKKP